jgi:hypothetical protein
MTAAPTAREALAELARRLDAAAEGETWVRPMLPADVAERIREFAATLPDEAAGDIAPETPAERCVRRVHEVLTPPREIGDEGAWITWHRGGMDARIVVGDRDLAPIARSATLRLAADSVPTLTLEQGAATRALLDLAGWRDADFVASLGRSLRIEAQRADLAERDLHAAQAELRAMHAAAQGRKNR